MNSITWSVHLSQFTLGNVISPENIEPLVCGNKLSANTGKTGSVW